MPDLQNSYGPEMAPSQDPQIIGVDSGLEALPAHQQHGYTIPPSYNDKAGKQNAYNGAPGTTAPRKRILGLSVAAFWGIIIGLVIALAVGLGAGLGVGLSSSSRNVSSSTASSASSSAAAATSATPTPTTISTASISSSTGTSSTSTITSTSSSASASATGASVAVCQNAYLDACTTISVPANSCIEFSSTYNDSISSLATGGPECTFYTGSSCTGSYWSTNGTQQLIPGEFNDKFSSVTCD